MRLIGRRCKHGDVFSLPVLIGRGLDLHTLLCLASHTLLFVQFSGFDLKIKSARNAPLAQLVEQLTLNQWVLGSSPRWCTKRPVGQAVKTPPSHGGDGSSILPRVTNEKRINTVSRAKSVQMAMRFHLFPFRTQKLSSYTPKILRWQRLGKIGLRRHPFVSS